MVKVIMPVTALLLGVALLQMGNGVQGTLLPVRAASESFSTFSVALLGSTYFVGFIAGCLWGPRLVSQVGHIRVFTAMAALASATPLAHGLILEPLPWWLLRVVTGFCFASLYVVIESWLNERATKETRGTIFALYLIINMTLMTLGQLLLVKFDSNSFELFALASILVSIAALPVALSKIVAPTKIPKSKINIVKIYRISPAGVVGCVCAGASGGAFWALAPQFASSAGFDVGGIAVFMSVTVLSGAVGQGPIGMLSDRFDRRIVMAIVSGLAALSGGTIFFLTGAGWLHPYILAAAWGFFSFPIYGLAAAHANDFAQPDQFVEVSGGLLLIYAIGAISGPVAAAALMTAVNESALFAFTTGVHVVLILFILWRARQRDTAPVEEHVRYIDALQATQSASSVIDSEVQESLVENAESDDLEASSDNSLNRDG